MTIPNANSVVVTVLKEKVDRMMKMVVKMAMVLMMMMSVNPGGLETIGRCLRLKVPDPSTLRPCYCYLVTCYYCRLSTLLPFFYCYHVTC